MSIGDNVPSAKIIDLMASIRALHNQLNDTISQISFLDVKEQKELVMIKDRFSDATIPTIPETGGI